MPPLARGGPRGGAYSPAGGRNGNGHPLPPGRYPSGARRGSEIQRDGGGGGELLNCVGLGGATTCFDGAATPPLVRRGASATPPMVTPSTRSTSAPPAGGYCTPGTSVTPGSQLWASHWPQHQHGHRQEQAAELRWVEVLEGPSARGVATGIEVVSGSQVLTKLEQLALELQRTLEFQSRIETQRAHIAREPAYQGGADGSKAYQRGGGPIEAEELSEAVAAEISPRFRELHDKLELVLAPELSRPPPDAVAQQIDHGTLAAAVVDRLSKHPGQEGNQRELLSSIEKLMGRQEDVLQEVLTEHRRTLLSRLLARQEEILQEALAEHRRASLQFLQQATQKTTERVYGEARGPNVVEAFAERPAVATTPAQSPRQFEAGLSPELEGAPAMAATSRMPVGGNQQPGPTGEHRAHLSDLGVDVQMVRKKIGDVEDEIVDAADRCESELDRYIHCPRLEAFQESSKWQLVCSSVILVNIVVLSWSSQSRMDVHQGRIQGGVTHEMFEDFFKQMDFAFVIFYTFELIVRVSVYRIKFFIGPDYFWNFFDLLLVVVGLQDSISWLTTSKGSTSLGYLRAVRLLKAAKLLRFVKLLRAFKELRLVLDSIMGSMSSMMWSMMLVFIIAFMFAMCFMHGVTEHFNVVVESNSTWGPLEDDLLERWGGISPAMLSLYKAATGGNDWSDISNSLVEIGPTYYILFMFYIAFFLFVITNSVTSIFVQSVREYEEKDQSEAIMDLMNRKQDYILKIADLFRMMDKDGSGEVSYDEFCKFSGDVRMRAFAASLDIEVNDLQQFFTILSSGGKREIDIETFVVGCIKLRGQATAMDMIDVLYTVRRIEDEVLSVRHDFLATSTLLSQRGGFGLAPIAAIAEHSDARHSEQTSLTRVEQAPPADLRETQGEHEPWTI